MLYVMFYLYLFKDVFYLLRPGNERRFKHVNHLLVVLLPIHA